MEPAQPAKPVVPGWAADIERMFDQNPELRPLSEPQVKEVLGINPIENSLIDEQLSKHLKGRIPIGQKQSRDTSWPIDLLIVE